MTQPLTHQRPGAQGRARSGPEWISGIERKITRLAQTVRSLRPVPVGAILRWPENVDPPAGWLFADGSDFDASTYPILANLLGDATTPAQSPGNDHTVWIIRAD